jgi:hypothetical protein
LSYRELPRYIDPLLDRGLRALGVAVGQSVQEVVERAIREASPRT